ncbi:MAG: hypothetical protein V3W36_02135 [Acidimicrobiia bacterium]
MGRRLRAAGVIVRVMDHWLRVTVGTVDENQLFVGALDAADEDPMSAEWH